ncbi:hypothetical protein LUZ60_005306 [Juncus effusus]|nr:hypothetical protein LUZ60_005306 [Juncus effusus]
MVRKEFTTNSSEMNDQSVNSSFSHSFLNWNNNHVINQFEPLISGNGLSLSLGSTTPQNSTPFFANSLASVLRNSPYFKPAQELLDEVVCVSNAAEMYGDEVSFNGRFLHLGELESNTGSSKEKQSLQSKLISLLTELESRHENYFNQMEQVVASFESILGAGAASCYTTLTVQAMLRHFTNLRDAIISQIHTSKEEEIVMQNNELNSERPKRENLRNIGMMQMRQVWRPLRGLPEDSVAVLRAWLFEHFLHPYPNDNEKLMLALRTGLSRNQISNWFINARVRLWKPMIEEMYNEEISDDSRDLSANSS